MSDRNKKKRQDDRRGYKVWTVRIASTKYPQLLDKVWLTEQYLVLKKSIKQLSKEVGCSGSSVVFVALNRLGIPRRNMKQAAKHGEKHHLWRGGSGFRSDTRYNEWRLMVYGRDNYTCQMCGERGVYLNAHHILPCRDFRDLIYDVSNGITLCGPCHSKTFNCEMEVAEEFKSVVKNRVNSVNSIGLFGKIIYADNTEPSQGIANRLLEGVETRSEETIMTTTPCTKVKI